MQLVVPSAVRNAVSAATMIFTVNSITFCFFIFSYFLNSDWGQVPVRKQIRANSDWGQVPVIIQNRANVMTGTCPL